MTCLVCNKDTGDRGTDGAVAVTTGGNWGSTVLDGPDKIVFSVCDGCLVARRSRIKSRIFIDGCHCPPATELYIDVPEDTIRSTL